MVQEQPEHREAILHAISSVDSGLQACEYENNLFHTQDHTETIETLKEMLKPELGPSPFQLLCSMFKKEKRVEKKREVTKERTPQKVEPLTHKNVAYYYATGEANKHLLSRLMGDGANTIAFSKAHKRSGRSLLEYNKTLALTKAGTIALDAFDSGAEVLVVESLEDYTYLTNNQKAIESVMGREIGLA
jgi:hypothetical protein